jgi:hypothetical protein
MLSSVDPSPAPTPGAKSNKSNKESLSSLADHLTVGHVTESDGYEWTNEDEFIFSMAI